MDLERPTASPSSLLVPPVSPPVSRGTNLADSTVLNSQNLNDSDPTKLDETVAELTALARALPDRINADPEKVEQGLARLVLTVIELLRRVLEHQAVRRMDGGSLTDEQVEQLGLALMKLSQRMDDLKETFGLSDDDLSIDLGPLGELR
jgi:Gas vesicle protein K